MRLKTVLQIAASFTVALTAGLLLQPTPYDACEPASLDAILDGGEITLAEDCVMMLDVEREIRGAVTVNGGMLHSGGLHRILYVREGAALTLNGVTVLSGAAELGEKQGGGIFNAGTLTLNRSTINSNVARYGGAIYSAGTLIARDSTFARNTAQRGGAIYIAQGSTATISNSLIADNSVRNGMGGGIFNAGEANIRNSSIRDNRVRSNVTRFDQGSSGGIYNNGEMTVVNTTIANNTAIYSGGIGNGADGDMTLLHSTIMGNHVVGTGDYGGYGGGINNRNLMVIAESRIVGNRGNGEGIGIDNNGGLVMTQSIIMHNVCTADDCRGVDFLQFGGQAMIRQNYWGADGPLAGHIAGLDAQFYEPYLTEMPAWAR